MQKICDECGELFETKRTNSRFCNKQHVRTCAVCNKEFNVSKQQLVDNKRCCSRECTQKFQHLQLQKSLAATTRTCLECGKSFIPTNNNQKYCDNDHYRPCPVCGKPVKVKNINDLKTTICRTCSDTCYRINLSNKLSEAKPKSDPKMSTCVICGTQFKLSYPYTQKTCSWKCRGIYRKESGISNQVHQKAVQTNLCRYGVTNPMQVAKFQYQQQESTYNSTGYPFALQSTTCIEKLKSTNRLKFGYDWAFQNPDIQAKYRESMVKKYGVDNYFKSAIRLEEVITDKSKIHNWLEFKQDPITYINTHYHSKPSVRDLELDLGVSNTPIYDILIQFDAKNCVNRYRSIIESEVIRFIQSIDDTIKIVEHDRVQIKPYELDIYLPEYQVAIECNPSWTHNSTIDPYSLEPKSYLYHKNKSYLAMSKGIQLFHIFGYEWRYKKDIIKSMIRNLLGKVDTKIYARNTYVGVVSYEEAKQFLTCNHRQGYTSAKWHLGLYDNTHQLQAMMSFGKIRLGIGKTAHDTNNCIELVRFCNKLNSTVVGGASKLFKYFIQNFSFDKIISFSDIAHTSGNLYSILGFKEMSESAPGYVWVNPATEQYYTRIQCQKHNLPNLFNDVDLDIENQTERQIMESRGYVQVFDSGVKRWEYTKV